MTQHHLTYAPVGATRERVRSGAVPGYRVLRARHRVARGGDETQRAALAQDLRAWRVHRAAGVRVRAAGPAMQGVEVVTSLGVGPLAVRAPTRVVWADHEGFGYGTLTGHPFAGEEAFRVVLRDGDVWLDVEAYSRPAQTAVRWAGPLVPVVQRLYVRLLARAARRLHHRRGAGRARQSRVARPTTCGDAGPAPPRTHGTGATSVTTNPAARIAPTVSRARWQPPAARGHTVASRVRCTARSARPGARTCS